MPSYRVSGKEQDRLPQSSPSLQAFSFPLAWTSSVIQGSSGGNIGELAGEGTGERLGCAGSEDLRAPRFSAG